MDYKKVEYYLSEIIKNEFNDRNSEIPLVVTRIKQEMNARGLLNSATTIHKIALFFEEEFKYRCNFIKDELLSAISKIKFRKNEDVITKVKTLYQNLSFKEKKIIISMFNEHVKQIESGLISNMPDQIRNRLDEISEKFLIKNNIVLAYEYESAIQQKSGNKIFFIKPNIMGTGLDVMALWDRIKT